MTNKPRRLVRSSRVDIPVKEASGLAGRPTDRGLRVLAIGDRSSRLAAAEYTTAGGLGDWQRTKLSTIPRWPVPKKNSQLEAIAVDGDRLVVLLREDPPVAVVADTEDRAIRAQITLTAPPGSPLAGHWDDPTSRGEGLVLLRGGRLLVAKEKRPRALVEFAPPGAAPAGLSRDDFLTPGERWEAPDDDVDFEAVSMWRLRGPAKKQLKDISALAVGPDRTLWLLSDKSKAIGHLSLETPLRPSDDEIRRFDEVWRLPKKAKKPEGVVALDDDHLLVALDTDRKRRNGMIVERPPRG